MAFLAPALTLLSTGLGIFSTVKGLTESKKIVGSDVGLPTGTPAVPTQADAAAKAQEEINKKRRSILTSNTDVTRGKALVSEGDVGKKSLLGQ